MRRVITAIEPFVVLLLAWALAANSELFSEALEPLFAVLPYILAALSLFMSIWYQNSNSFYLVFFILCSYVILNVSADHHNPEMLYEAVTFISVLLPLNAVWLGFSKERGVFSSYGRNKGIVILAQIIWTIINAAQKSGAASAVRVGEAAIRIGAPTTVLYVLAVCILIAGYIFQQHYMALVFVSILLASYILLSFAGRPLLTSIFATSIFAVTVLALFEVSYSLAFYDPLTGVLSRRALEQELLNLRNNYTIAMVDLDHFKRINDKYGHDVGDEVLKMVASLLKKNSGNGRVFRYGGEEFVIIFPELSYNRVLPQLERLRKAIERRPFILRAENRPKEKPDDISKFSSQGRGKFNVTVSIGAAHKSDRLRTSQEVVKKADEAMYISKNSGRNCITKN